MVLPRRQLAASHVLAPAAGEQVEGSWQRAAPASAQAAGSTALLESTTPAYTAHTALPHLNSAVALSTMSTAKRDSAIMAAACMSSCC